MENIPTGTLFYKRASNDSIVVLKSINGTKGKRSVYKHFYQNIKNMNNKINEIIEYNTTKNKESNIDFDYILNNAPESKEKKILIDSIKEYNKVSESIKNIINKEQILQISKIINECTGNLKNYDKLVNNYYILNRAEVVDIYSLYDKTIKYDTVCSIHDNNFLYKIGEIVSVDEFNYKLDDFNGIHVFTDKYYTTNSNLYLYIQ